MSDQNVNTQQLHFNSKKYILAGWMVLFLWAPWSVINTLFFKAIDPAWFRFSVAISMVVFFSLYTKSKKFNPRTAENILALVCIIGGIHIIYLCSVNDYRILFVAGTFALQVVYTFIIGSIFHFCLINIPIILAVPILGLYYNVPQEPWAAMLFLLTTVTVGQGLALHQKIKNQNQLLESMQKLGDSEKARLQSAKMASLGEMAGGIAHEINNPVSIIQGKAAMISRWVSNQQMDPEKIKASADKIVDTVQRIGKITKGLLVFARDSDSDPFRSADIVPVIENTIEMVREKMTKAGIEMILQQPASLNLDCRESQVSQVLMNLLGNAMDAIAGDTESKKWIEILSSLEDEYFILSVKDSGKGIPEAVVEKMMQPFFSTKEVNKGTGLGLSTAEGIARQHKGSLTYDADTGHTRFVFKIPLRQEGALAVDEVDSEMASSSAQVQATQGRPGGGRGTSAA
ncbi:MAG: sensor histidine kinase [Pseudobdellovibrionaceae bacterium]